MPTVVKQTARVLIIGFGNPLRGDDAIGPMIAEALDERFDADQRVRVMIRQTLTPDLSADIAAADRVLFLDAGMEGKPGQVRFEPVFASEDASVAMVHFLDPTALLTWSARLYGAKPEAMILSVTGERFDFSLSELSPRLQALLDELIHKSVQWISAADHDPVDAAKQDA